MAFSRGVKLARPNQQIVASAINEPAIVNGARLIKPNINNPYNHSEHALIKLRSLELARRNKTATITDEVIA